MLFSLKLWYLLSITLQIRLAVSKSCIKQEKQLGIQALLHPHSLPPTLGGSKVKDNWEQNRIFLRESKQVKLSLQVQCDNTVNKGISQPTMLFQKWDVQILARVLMWTVSVNIPRRQSLSRLLFLPLKPRVLQPETVALAHHHFFTSARLSYIEYFVIKQNSLFLKFMLCWDILLRKLEVNNEIFWTASQQPQNSWQAKKGPRRLESSYWALLCWVYKAFRKKMLQFL